MDDMENVVVSSVGDRMQLLWIETFLVTAGAIGTTDKEVASIWANHAVDEFKRKFINTK